MLIAGETYVLGFAAVACDVYSMSNKGEKMTEIEVLTKILGELSVCSMFLFLIVALLFFILLFK